MSAPSGNQYAEKWTFDKTVEALKTINHYSFQGEYLYLGHALSAAGLYDDVWRYWKRKWKKQHEIIDLMKMILQRFEAKIFVSMAEKKIPERVGMFALRHHYGWGRETDPTLQPYEDLSYVDQELIVEPAPSPGETSQPETLDPDKIPIHQLPRTHPPHDERYSSAMRMEYNSLNRQNKLLDPLPYFNGQPPTDLPVIKFKDGYFLKA